MKKLGLIGGMGPESTVPYYHDIVYGVQNRLGRDVFPNLTIESVDVFQVLGMCMRQDYDGLVEYLLTALRNLAAAGAEFGALSANTPHIVFDRLEQESPIPLVSIVEATCQEVVRRNKKKVGLLGTRFTMEGAFYHRPFQRAGVTLVTPDEGERLFVNEKITNELERGIVKPETQAAFLQIVRRMVEEEGIEALILGCTELPLLFQSVAHPPVECLDTVAIHVAALVDRILEAE